MSNRRDDILERIYANTVQMDCGHRVLVDGEWQVSLCRIWQGPTSGRKREGDKNTRGHSYPRWTLNGQTVAVHRVVFTHFKGYIPSRKHVDHNCKMRGCVEGEHLEMVSHKENCKRRDKANGVKRRPKKRKKMKHHLRLVA